MTAKLRLDLDPHVNLGDIELFLKRAYQAGLNSGDFVDLLRGSGTDTLALQTPDIRFTRTTLR